MKPSVTASRFSFPNPLSPRRLSWLSPLLQGRVKRLKRKRETNVATALEALEDRTLLSVSSLVVDDVTLIEGDDGTTDLQFDVVLQEAVGAGLTVSYHTIDETAVAGEDYVATNGMLHFAGEAGETQSVIVPLLGDDVVESDETFRLEVSTVNQFFSVNWESDELIALDSITGEVQTIGPIGKDMWGTDLTWQDGIVYAVTADGDRFSFPNWDLVAIDPNTGAMLSEVPITLNGETPNVVDGITARDGTLLLMFDMNDLTSSMLGEIDPATGEVTFLVDYKRVHNFNYDFDGISVNAAGDLFAVDSILFSGDLNQIAFFALEETAPYAVTFTGDFVDRTSVADLATDGEALYGLDRGMNDLLRLDPEAPPGAFTRLPLDLVETNLNGLAIGEKTVISAVGAILNDDTATVSLNHAAYEQQILADNPLGYWRLGELAGSTVAVDSSGNGFDGLYDGTVLLEQQGALSGNPDTAAEFDGATGRVILSDMDEIQNLQNNLTVEAWVRTDSLGGTQRIFTSGRTVDPSAGFRLQIINSRLRFSAFGVQAYDSPAGLIQAGQWQHVAAVMDDRNDVSFYLDGQFITKIEGFAPAVPVDGDGWIGALRDDGIQHFDGLMDEVAVYGHALSADHVQLHYALGASERNGGGPPTFAFSEGDTAAKPFPFAVTLSNPVDVPVTVEINSTDGSATLAGGDYSPLVGQVVTFHPGGPLTQFLTTDVHGDTDFEADEFFILNATNLSTTSSDVSLGNDTAVVLIRNDDTRPVAVNLSPEPDTHTVPPAAEISAEFPFGLNENRFVVHSGFSGELTESEATVNRNDDVLVVTPHQPFHPGETIQVTARSLRQEEEILPVVWQFRTRTSPFGSGLFDRSEQELGESNSLEVVLGDLDGDGDLDLFTANRGANTVWFNDGRGVFTDSGQRLGDDDSWGARLGDLDGDGDLDLVVANFGSPDHVLFNDGTGQFTDSGQMLQGPSGEQASRDVALGDLDGDGDLDAFIATSAGTLNQVFLNDGSGTFSSIALALPGARSFDVALADFDSDGDLDAFLTEASTSGRANLVLFNDGKGFFRDSGQRLGSEASRGLAVGDIDGDGDLDAVVGDDRGGGTRFWINDGQGVFTAGDQVIPGANLDVTLGDLDGDGDLDLFIPDSDGNANTIWYNDGLGNFRESLQQLGDDKSTEVALGDIDGDGDLDAVVANWDLQPNTVWFNRDAIRPGTPRLTGPVPLLSDATPVISWQELPGADSYELQVFQVGQSSPVIDETGLTGTFFTPDVPLPETQFQVRVRGVNDPEAGPWSDPLVFSISPSAESAPLAPSLTGPRAEVSDRTPLVTWNEFPSAQSYHLVVTNTATAAEVLNVNGITDTWFTPALPLPLGSYQAVIAANLDDGSHTPFAPAHEFTIHNTPPALRPLSDQRIPDGVNRRRVKLFAADADGDPLTATARATFDPTEELAYDLDQQFNFVSDPDFVANDYYFDARGLQERYLPGFFILPDGEIFRWAGSIAQSRRLGTLEEIYHNNPELLIDVPHPGAGLEGFIADDTVAEKAHALDNRFDFQLPAGFLQTDFWLGARGHRERYLPGFFLLPGGDLYRWNGGIQTSLSVGFVAVLDGRYYENPALLVNAPDPSTGTHGSLANDPAALRAVDLDLRFDFELLPGSEANNFWENARGLGEKYLAGFYMLPDGDLYRWGGSIAASTLVGSLDARFHANPALLVDALAQLSPPPAPPLVSVSGLGVSIDLPENDYRRSFIIQVSLSDGLQTVHDSFRVDRRPRRRSGEMINGGSVVFFTPGNAFNPGSVSEFGSTDDAFADPDFFEDL